MVAIEVQIVESDIDATWKLLLIVRIPGGPEHKCKLVLAWYVREQNTELSILSLQLDRVIVGVFIEGFERSLWYARRVACETNSLAMIEVPCGRRRR